MSVICKIKNARNKSRKRTENGCMTQIKNNANNGIK